MKAHINLVFIGHVDHGKSTLIGRMLFDAGMISEKDLLKLKEYAKAIGKETFEFAFIMDKSREERERGLTIDIAYKELSTPKNDITIIDAPGHRDFVKNMITGASQADATVLVVAADDGVMPQTREHAFLAKTLGIRQIIVAINKMDLANYNQSRYDMIKADVEKLLLSIGYKLEEITFTPISAFHGDNVVKRSSKMGWYDGLTVFEALDQLKPPLTKPVDKPLRIPIQNIFSIKGVGAVPIGRVETGILKVEQEVIFEPAHVKAEVKSIEMHHKKLDKAEPGDNIGFNVRGISSTDVQRGDVCGPIDNPPLVAKEFVGRIIILEHPTSISLGYTPVLHCHTATVPCVFTELIQKLDPRTGAVIEEKPKMLKKGDAAVVRLVPTKPLVIEKVSDFPPLGRFALRHGGQTVAVGMCIEVVSR
ncbi:MAG: translation elongation factor EF-1 subunit alpha [Euryarchaeota archaeon]|nr:translation elongation factor EF-1 subunit alpha [Euryarchaeota archaeon]